MAGISSAACNRNQCCKVSFDRYGLWIDASRRRYPFNQPMSDAFKALMPA